MHAVCDLSVWAGIARQSEVHGKPAMRAYFAAVQAGRCAARHRDQMRGLLRAWAIFWAKPVADLAANHADNHHVAQTATTERTMTPAAIDKWS